MVGRNDRRRGLRWVNRWRQQQLLPFFSLLLSLRSPSACQHHSSRPLRVCAAPFICWFGPSRCFRIYQFLTGGKWRKAILIPLQYLLGRFIYDLARTMDFMVCYVAPFHLVVPQHVNPSVQLAWPFILFGDESKMRPMLELAIGYTNFPSCYYDIFSKIKFLSSWSDNGTLVILSWSLSLSLSLIVCVCAYVCACVCARVSF